MARGGGLRILSRRVVAVDPEACRRCGLCVKACPLGALEGGPGSVPRVSEALCIGCGICMEACPFNAILFVEKRSFAPLAFAVGVLVVAALALAVVYAAPGLWAAGGEGGGPGEAVEPGGIELPYQAGGEPASIEYYAVLEEEAGTEGG